MMELKELDLNDRGFVHGYLVQYPQELSEFTFTNLFLWRHGRPVYYALFREALIFFVDDSSGGGSKKIMFGPPMGDLEPGDLAALIREETGGAVRMSARYAGALKGMGFVVEEDRDNDDYLYRVADLGTLVGRKYSKKRNHIKNCLNDYHCLYEPISSRNIAECLDLQDKWCNIKGCDITPGLYHEDMAVREAFRHFDEFGIFGGAIRIDGVIQAYAVGERLNRDTAVCHFEKANTEYNGLNQLITHWFAKYSLGDYVYENREQDMGNPGLRQAKMSYYPVQMVSKYSVKLPA